MRYFVFAVVGLTLTACISSPRVPASDAGQPLTVLSDVSQTKPLSVILFPHCDGDPTRKIKQETFVYKSIGATEAHPSVELRAYVFSPNDNASTHPAIAMFHGGGWKDGYPVTWFPAALYYASRGFVTVSFQYRLTKIHGTTPKESVADAKSAFRWIVANANTLRVDRKKIVLAGDSAGAQIALGISLFDGFSDELAKPAVKPRAQVALYPLVDTAQYGLPEMSPLLTISSNNLPPTLILQGAYDAQPGTPPAQSKAFCEKANELADQTVCESNFFDDKAYFHGFIGARKPYYTTLTKMNEFLTEQGLMAKADVKTPLPETCVAPAKEPLFESWVKSFGYSTSTSSLWKP